ncbi:MAG TPA: hypothetical protein VGM03_00220 [Phycisphaerae bacterium]
MQIRRWSAFAAFVTVVALSASAYGQIALNPGSIIWLSLRGTDNVVGFAPAGISSLPANGTLMPMAVGASASAAYDFSSAAFNVNNAQFALSASNGVSSSADLYGQINFTATTAVPWNLAGSLSWMGNWANGVSLFARLQDLTTGSDVTLHNYASAGVLSSVTLTVGSGGGNSMNVIGPTSGTLTAGHAYQYTLELAADSNPYSPQTGMAMGNLSLSFGTQTVTITAANPPAPAGNPYQPGQIFTDVLDTGSGPTVTAGIGAPGTLDEGPISYSPIHVTFSGAPVPPPAPDNVVVGCVGGSLPCPTITAISPGPGANEYAISISGGMPPLSCMTFIFTGNAAGQRLHYYSNPGNLNLDSFGSTTQDVLFLIQNINDGSANLPENLARFNVNRSHLQPPHVNTQDVLRVVQLLNGVNTTQVFNGTHAAACPP